MSGNIERFIRDKQGCQYQLKSNYDERGFLLVKLKRRNDEIGRVQCVLHSSGEMLIGDLIISDAVVHTSTSVGHWLWRKLFKLKPVNYRGKGLGTQLLEFALDFARHKGMKSVYGSLTQKDIAATPNLVSWYMKHGFKLVPPTDEDPSTAVHRISQWI